MMMMRRGWTATLSVIGLVLAGTAGGQGLTEEQVASVAFANREHAMVSVVVFGPGPSDRLYLIMDPHTMGEDSRGRTVIQRVARGYSYVPGNPQWSAGPQPLPGREMRGEYAFRNLELTTRDGNQQIVVSLDGSMQVGSPMPRWVLTGRMQRIEGPRRSEVHFHHNGLPRNDLMPLLARDPPARTLVGEPTLSLRATEGGRLIVADLTMDAGVSAARLLPGQGAESQIRVEALDTRGTVAESLTLRNRRDTFQERDSWTGRMRRLRAGESYTLRATIDLGLWGALEESTEITVFDL